MNKLYGEKKASVYSEWSFVTTGPFGVHTELILSGRGLCHLCGRLARPPWRAAGVSVGAGALLGLAQWLVVNHLPLAWVSGRGGWLWGLVSHLSYTLS